MLLRPGRHCLGHAERTALDAAFRDKWREVVTRWGAFQHLAYPLTQTHVHRRLLLSACWPSMAYNPAPENPRPPSPYQNMEYSPFLLLCHHYHLHSNLSAAWDEWQGEGSLLLGWKVSQCTLQWISENKHPWKPTTSSQKQTRLCPLSVFFMLLLHKDLLSTIVTTRAEKFFPFWLTPGWKRQLDSYSWPGLNGSAVQDPGNCHRRPLGELQR